MTGWRMPAEWEPHERTLMAWPQRSQLWGDRFDAAKDDYATCARAIARFEPVTILAAPGAIEDARTRCTGGDADIEVVAMPLDDSWVRDTGPLIVMGEEGERVGCDFAFNAWGGKYEPYDDDARVGERVCELLGIERRPVDFVLEGGAISVDGEGTAIVTEQCVLNENRNKGATKDDVEAVLRDSLGIEKVIWLGRGLVEDVDTDGHVDNICQFVRPAGVVLQVLKDQLNSNWESTRENKQRLREAKDAAGRDLTVYEVEVLPHVTVDDRTHAVPYLNFYVCNGGVVVPVTGGDADDSVMSRVRTMFPGREVVTVPGSLLAMGGGGVHCITMQVPAGGH